jgi:hypothetical protein
MHAKRYASKASNSKAYSLVLVALSVRLAQVLTRIPPNELLTGLIKWLDNGHPNKRQNKRR